MSSIRYYFVSLHPKNFLTQLFPQTGYFFCNGSGMQCHMCKVHFYSAFLPSLLSLSSINLTLLEKYTKKKNGKIFIIVVFIDLVAFVFTCELVGMRGLIEIIYHRTLFPESFVLTPKMSGMGVLWANHIVFTHNVIKKY